MTDNHMIIWWMFYWWTILLKLLQVVTVLKRYICGQNFIVDELEMQWSQNDEEYNSGTRNCNIPHMRAPQPP